MIKNKIDQLHYLQMNKPLDFAIGDTVNVHYRIKEGDKSRIQTYEGVVIAIKNRGAGKSFTVRRISYDVGVERVFPLYAPSVEKIEVIRSGKVRRSKLYFLREKIGKHGRLKDIKRKPITDKIFEKAKQVQEAQKAAQTQKVVAETPQEEVAETSTEG